MCIRDRIGTWGLNKTVGWAFDITNFVFWVGIGHAGTLISACLLYTSDAADERSSVDLGGRRIIKKKKTTAEVGCQQLEYRTTQLFIRQINHTERRKKTAQLA